MSNRVNFPQMEYEVRENGIDWDPVDPGKASECNGGYLRYIKDGFAKTAATGNWRAVMSVEYANQLAKYQAYQRAKTAYLWCLGAALYLPSSSQSP